MKCGPPQRARRHLLRQSRNLTLAPVRPFLSACGRPAPDHITPRPFPSFAGSKREGCQNSHIPGNVECHVSCHKSLILFYEILILNEKDLVSASGSRIFGFDEIKSIRIMSTRLIASILVLTGLVSVNLVSSQSQVVESTQTVNRKTIQVHYDRLNAELNRLFFVTDSINAELKTLEAYVDTMEWADVLQNGAVADRQLSFGGYNLMDIDSASMNFASADSLVVAKVIEGKISSLANHNTDSLPEGASHRFFTSAREAAIQEELDSIHGVLNDFVGALTVPTIQADSSAATSAGWTLYARALPPLVGGIDSVVFAVSTSATMDVADSIWSTNLDADGSCSVYIETDVLPPYWTATARNKYSTSEPSAPEGVGLFECGTPVSYLGDDYATVAIGDQCWFVDNLRTEVYANGDSLDSNLSDATWKVTSAGAYSIYGEGTSTCFGNCDESTTEGIYGLLYNWYAVTDARGICPSGWHQSTDSDWIQLEAHLGIEAGDLQMNGNRGIDQGDQIKATPSNVIPWNGTNLHGFDATPGGYRYWWDGKFTAEGTEVIFWTTEVASGTNGWGRMLKSSESGIRRSTYNYHTGAYIRCVLGAS